MLWKNTCVWREWSSASLAAATAASASAAAAAAAATAAAAAAATAAAAPLPHEHMTYVSSNHYDWSGRKYVRYGHSEALVTHTIGMFTSINLHQEAYEIGLLIANVANSSQGPV